MKLFRIEFYALEGPALLSVSVQATGIVEALDQAYKKVPEDVIPKIIRFSYFMTFLGGTTK